MENQMISVIIPIFNRIDYLNKSVDSVLEQKNVNIELILIDDGSTDGSSDVIDSYAARLKNVVAIHQPNQGLSAARNAGLDICKGKYIFFLDSDDYIENGALLRLLKIITENDTDIVIGKYSRYLENGTLEYENHIPDNLKNKVLDKRELLSLMYIENSYLWCVAWGKLYRREVFDNIRFPVGKASEDEFIMPQILEKIKSIYLLDEELYHQTLSANSIVRSSITVKKLDATEAILYMIDYLIEHDLYELALFRFGVGTRHLMKWKSETNDKEILNGINEQYRLYKKRAKTMLAHVDFLDRVRLILFCINFNLYSFIRNVIK